MENSNVLAYFIIASGIAIVFTLLGIVYEMHKSKCTYTRTVPSPPEHLKPCNHQFPIHEPITNENPKCIKCGQRLSKTNPILWTQKN